MQPPGEHHREGLVDAVHGEGQRRAVELRQIQLKARRLRVHGRCSAHAIGVSG